MNSTYLGAHAGYAAGPFSVQIGVGYAWHDIDAARGIAFPGFSSASRASYDATTRQFFGEIAYALKTGQYSFTPFFGLARIETRTDGFAERGGSVAALTVANAKQNISMASLGLRAGGEVRLDPRTRLVPNVSLSWRHGWGDRLNGSSARFASGTNAFTVIGQGLPRSSAEIDAGVHFERGRFNLGADYIGSIANRWSDHGGQLTIGVRF